MIDLTAELKERLNGINPPLVMTGPETDALMALCRGWRPIEGAEAIAAFDDRPTGDRWHGTRIWVCGDRRMACDECGNMPNLSEDLGLAFETLWPWLCEKVREVPQSSSPLYPPDMHLSATRLKVSPGDTLDIGGRVEFLQKFDHLEAIHLCRAVIFVAKNLPEKA